MGFSGDIDVSRECCDEHARDASIFSITPQRVAYPRTTKDVQAIVNDCALRGMPVAVRAGGTCMSGGSLTQGTVINMTRYMGGVYVDPLTRRARVSGGTLFTELEHALDQHNLMCPAYPSSKDDCGVMGMIGNNASGEKSVRYGATIDVTSALEVVLADGSVLTTHPLSRSELEEKMSESTREGELYRGVHELYDRYHEGLVREMGRVPKVASGYRLDRWYDTKTDTYSLTPLFVGAQGTLGIVTKATVSAVPKPRFLALLAISVSSLDVLPEVVTTVLNGDPDAVETFDINTYKRAQKFFPDEAGRVEHLFTSGTELIVMAEFASNQTLTDACESALRCEKALTTMGISSTLVGPGDMFDALWTLRRNSFRVFRDSPQGTKHAIPCIEDIIVPVPALTPLIRGLKDMLAQRGLAYGFHGHIGEGSLRILPMLDLASPTVVSDIVSLSTEVFALIHSLEGNMSADHSDGIIRTPFVPDFYPTSNEAFIALKKLFDPANILNPGKKVGGTVEDIKRHMVNVS